MKRLLLIAMAVSLLHTSWAQVSFTSSNLPVVIINTNGQQIVDEPKITAGMGLGSCLSQCRLLQWEQFHRLGV